MENPFKILVYDKDLVFRGYVGDPVSLTATPRWNAIGTATLVVDINHRLLDVLTADGARLVIQKDGLFLMSGKIYQREGLGPSTSGSLTLSLRSDYRLLSQILAWPVPTAALTAQTSEYYTATGSAESIVKNVVTANMITRLGMNVTCAADQNRGSVITDGITFRFHPLAERLFPTIEEAGIGITFEQQGAVIVCDVIVPPVYGMVLTEESGALTSWSWTSTDPTATRVVAGGQGEGITRAFSSIADTVLEGNHNDIVEVFRDSRESSNGTSTALGSRADETLKEGAPTSGFVISLAETETFRYGRNGLVVGAMVTISVAGVTRTDLLREVTMTYTHADGIVVTPVIGEIQNNPDRTIAKFLARLKKSVGDLKVSK